MSVNKNKPNKPIAPNRRWFSLRRLGGAGLFVGLATAAILYVGLSPSQDEQAGLRIERSGQTAFWVAPAQEPALSDGKALYGMFCASCHGAKMQGQPNWRSRMANGRLPAPPHDMTGHTWHHPDALLLSLIRDGLVPGISAPDGYESDMPALGAALSDRQIKSILAYIKTYWPADILKAQKEISLQSM